MTLPPVYSTLLVNEQNSGSWEFVPPSGYLAVVTSFTVYNGGTLPTVDEIFFGTSGTVVFQFQYPGVLPVWTPVPDIRIVVPQGESLKGTCSGDQGADWQVSGFLLTLP